ncbi:terminase TerL endonuclease subunit [Roseospira visakhapatnamensis]|uniref:Phage terminase large subunit-like protein n=1 Tax=Roseospira visakhapatnamensis TaxID=390880 RepID=A0A7W6WB94_9PROT|nr:phage terminase large subunit-like protein [Roseospira visakhapatnamensis]
MARTRKRKGSACPVETYARDVLDGRVVAGRLVRLACRRHLDDLQGGSARGLVWSPEAARHALEFFGHLRHSTGEWAGQPFTLQPWQAFVVGALYGWQRGDGLRRFRTAYVEVARKNGKSVLLAGTALYALVADHEPGSQVYAAATTRDQARIVFGEAERMVDASPALRSRVTRTVNNLAVTATASWFRPLSADASKMDGLNVHFAAVDEVHEHPNAEIIQKLNTATGARRQPLIFEITTAGHDRHSVCRQHHEFSVKALEGSVPPEAADSWFAFIATLDDGDDWTDPAVWIKANPSLGVTVKEDDLRRQIEEAREMPAQQNAIRRLRLNEWTEQVTRWLDMAVWEDGGPPVATDAADVKADLDDLEAALAGRPCYGGLDLARVNDLSAFVLLFPPTGDPDLGPLAARWIAVCRFWVPEDDILRRARRDRVPYDVWRDQGFLTATPGNATDFAFIEHEILALAGRFDLRELAYDRTFAGEIVQTLQQEGLSLIEFGQGFLSLAAPTAELERLVVSRSFWHGGHPVLRWNASNVAVRQDPAGNIKPDKERSSERIDGIAALVNALGRALVQGGVPGRSIYETQELVFL